MNKILRQILFWTILAVAALGFLYGIILGDAALTRMEASTL